MLITALVHYVNVSPLVDLCRASWIVLKQRSCFEVFQSDVALPTAIANCNIIISVQFLENSDSGYAIWINRNIFTFRN